jgi:hypothetical protein
MPVARRRWQWRGGGAFPPSCCSCCCSPLLLSCYCSPLLLLLLLLPPPAATTRLLLPLSSAARSTCYRSPLPLQLPWLLLSSAAATAMAATLLCRCNCHCYHAPLPLQLPLLLLCSAAATVIAATLLCRCNCHAATTIIRIAAGRIGTAPQAESAGRIRTARVRVLLRCAGRRAPSRPPPCRLAGLDGLAPFRCARRSTTAPDRIGLDDPIVVRQDQKGLDDRSSARSEQRPFGSAWAISFPISPCYCGGGCLDRSTLRLTRRRPAG